MARAVTFSLNIDAAGKEVLQGLVKNTIEQSGKSIAGRAQSMASTMSGSADVQFKTSNSIGTIKRGQRAITTVSASFGNSREQYIARQALAKAKDAGRLK